MLADGSVYEWTCRVEETADRLARDAVQQLQSASVLPNRFTLPPGLFDPCLPNHPLPAQPPARAREAAQLAAVIASSPPPGSPLAPSESASLLSAVDAILAEAEAVLEREQHEGKAEQKASRRAERRMHHVERKEATEQANETKRQLRNEPALQTERHIPTPHSTTTRTTQRTRQSIAALPQSSHSADVLRLKAAIELRTEQRRKERDEAVKAEMLDRQRRDIIARYEEAEGRRRVEERKEQEDELHISHQETRAKEQQEQKHREEESKRQHFRQELEDKKRLAAEAIRHQRLLAKQQQQQQLLTHHTQTLQRRADKRLLQRSWQLWVAAFVEARRAKQLKAVSAWRYHCSGQHFRLWRSVVRQAKEERRRVEEESLRRRKEDRRVQAEAHWKLKCAQRSASNRTPEPRCARTMHYPLLSRSHPVFCFVVYSLFTAWRWCLQVKGEFTAHSSATALADSRSIAH